MNFGIKPDKRVPLHIVHQSNVHPADGNTLRLNYESFPIQQGGVYIIRFEQKCVPRLRGDSPILRIGHTKEYYQRIQQYGTPDVGADFDVPLSESLHGKNKSDKITIYALLEFLKQGDSIVVNLHYKASERKLLYEYVNEHWETPPLNFNLNTKV